MNIENYIDERNLAIWTKLNAIYEIELIYNRTESSWRIKMEIESKSAKIITPTRKLQIASFTHELLHLYLAEFGMSTDKEILYSIYGEKSFNILTKNGLFGKIHNFCSHKKMYPYFVEMGFPENSFIQKPAKFSFISYYLTKRQLKQKNENGITDYIGFTISLMNNMGETNKEYNQKKLIKLKQMEPSLYEIIERFDQNWDNSIEFDLVTPFKKFDSELENWIKK